MVTWLMHFPALHSRFGDTALFMCVLSWVCGRKSVRLCWSSLACLVARAESCVLCFSCCGDFWSFSSVVVNNSLRLVRLEAAVCSTLSASLRCVFLNSESSKT